jgi:hypothetical protein
MAMKSPMSVTDTEATAPAITAIAIMAIGTMATDTMPIGWDIATLSIGSATLGTHIGWAMVKRGDTGWVTPASR